MSIRIPERRFDPDVPEMIDLSTNDHQLLRDDLKNLRDINKFFGGLSSVKKSIVKLFDKIDDQKKIEILDLATGSADHPVAILKLALNMNRLVHVTAIDQNYQILDIAREQTRPFEEIDLQQGDIFALPYSANSFDIVLCSLTIHHFSREQAINLLKTMRQLSKVGFIVNDLNRSWFAAWTTWLYTHLTTRNSMTLNDSYLSVLRAFTPAELCQMAQQAGIKHFVIRKHPFFRLILIGEHK